MTTRLQLTAQRLAEKTVTEGGITVTYTDSTGAVLLSAALGSQLLKLSDGKGNTKIERTDRDFIVKTADLGREPVRGATIDAAIDVTSDRYEVMAPGKEPHFRYCDPYKTLIRIHTKYWGPTP